MAGRRGAVGRCDGESAWHLTVFGVRMAMVIDAVFGMALEDIY